MIGVVAGLIGLLLAVTPAEVGPVVEVQGFYIEPGAPASRAAVEEAVAEARFAGGNLHIVVLADEPPGGATVFADGVLNELPGGGTVFVVAPETLGWASIDDIYTEEQLDDATNAAFGGSTDTEVVQLFVSELTGEPVGGTSSASGGGVGWLLLIGVAVIAVVGFFVWRSSRKQKEQAGARMDAAKGEVQKLLDAVANDILELEDEVKLSDNEQAQDHYERASATYAAAERRLRQATKPLDLLALSNDLDVAIWELDCAEAVLDGKELPPKPEPRRPEPAPQPAPQPRPAPAPGSGYARRPNRRSSYMNRDMLNAILMAGAAVASSRRWGGGPSRYSRAPSRSSRRSGGGRSGGSSRRRMRGGGRRRR